MVLQLGVHCTLNTSQHTPHYSALHTAQKTPPYIALHTALHITLHTALHIMHFVPWTLQCIALNCTMQRSSHDYEDIEPATATRTKLKYQSTQYLLTTRLVISEKQHKKHIFNNILVRKLNTNQQEKGQTYFLSIPVKGISKPQFK